MVDISDEVIGNAANGDMAAFEGIYRAYSGYVYRIALRMVNNYADAEEVVQDVFLLVYGQLKNFRYEASLKTWIYRIAVNTTLNFRKKRSRVRANRTELQEHTLRDSSSVKPDFGEAEDRERMVEKLLAVLNPDQRACVVLRSIEGLSYEEIAETLDVNINTVRTRLKRAREKMLSVKEEVMNNEIH